MVVICWTSGRTDARESACVRYLTKIGSGTTERYIMANAEKREYIQGYRDRRTLNDLLELWWMYHYQHRRKAEEDRKQLRNIINELGADMQAVDLDKLKIIAWRSQKIAEGLKPSSANRYMNRLSGMFTVLKK